MTVYLYMWRHGSLFVDDYESVEDAVRSAVSTEDYGNGYAHGLEVDGRWVSPKDDEWEGIKKAKHDAEDAEYAARPDPTHVVEIQPIDGDRWAYFTEAYSLDEGLEKARALGLPPDRLRVRTTGPKQKFYSVGYEETE